MKSTMTLTIIIIVFILGLLFMILNKPKPLSESFFGNKDYQCPNILIRKDNIIYLYNSNQVKVPGRNPIKFNSLEDYIEYTRWQRSKGIRCPALFLQHTYNTQGNSVYKVHPSPSDLKGGLDQIAPIDEALSKDVIKTLDATHDHISNNNNKDNAYAAFDPDNQYIGDITRLDEIHSLTIDGKSVNPLDSNWGGGHFTQSAVNKGYFTQNEVNKGHYTHKKKSPRS